MTERLDEAISRYDDDDPPFWRASLRTWRSFAALLSGDLAGATAYSDQALAAVPESGEYWVRTWALWVQALVASQEGRTEDAIGTYEAQVELCGEIGYVRGTVVSAEGLGQANIAAARYDAAAAAFIDGIASADAMGMVADVLSMMRWVAQVRALQGRPEEAVELLATVVADPASVHLPFTEDTAIRDIAETALVELRAGLDPGVFEAAYARGAERPSDIAAKELLAG